MSFKFEGFYLKRLRIWRRVNPLRGLSMILLKLTFLGSGATLPICLPASLGGHFSKIRSSGFLWVTWHCHLDSEFGRDAQILGSINSRIRIFLAPRRQERQLRKSILFLCGPFDAAQ